MTMGSRIVALRKELQLSQEEMADKIGVTRQSVSKWETDVSAPDGYNLIALAEVLNTSVEYIVTGKVIPEPKVQVKASADITSNPKRSNLAILGFILVAGGILMALIGMFLDFVWCIIGGFIAATGFICALCKSKKSLIIAFAVVFCVIGTLVVLMLTL